MKKLFLFLIVSATTGVISAIWSTVFKNNPESFLGNSIHAAIYIFAGSILFWIIFGREK